MKAKKQEETLDTLIEREKREYLPVAIFQRLCATHLTGLNEYTLDALEIKLHIEGCRNYFNMYGTIYGEETPWLIGGAANAKRYR